MVERELNYLFKLAKARRHVFASYFENLEDRLTDKWGVQLKNFP